METPVLDFLATQDLEFFSTLDLDCSSELFSQTSDHEESNWNEKRYPAPVIPISVVMQQIAPDLKQARFTKYLIALRASGIEEVRWYGGGAIHDFQTTEVESMRQRMSRTSSAAFRA